MSDKNEIIPFLFIGDLECALTDFNQFALIVNVTVCEKFPPLKGKGRKRIRIPINDDPDDAPDLVGFLQKTSCLKDIHDSIANEQNVLIHCQLGMQRSPAVCACYLITYRGFEPQEAIDFIRSQRPVAFPGGGVRLLEAIEKIYRLKIEKLSSPEQRPKVAVIEPIAALLVQPLLTIAEISGISEDTHSSGGSSLLGHGDGSFHFPRVDGSPRHAGTEPPDGRAEEAGVGEKTAEGTQMKGVSGRLVTTLLTFADSLSAVRDFDPVATAERLQTIPFGIKRHASVDSSSFSLINPQPHKPVFWHGLEMPGPKGSKSPTGPIGPAGQLPRARRASASSLGSGKSRQDSWMDSEGGQEGSDRDRLSAAILAFSANNTEVFPGLYVGDEKCALGNIDDVNPWQVMINCTVALQFPPGSGSSKQIRIPIDEGAESAELHSFLKTTTCLIDMHNALEENGRVLVYCDGTRQRSAAVMACYFIVYHGMDVSAGVAFVRGQLQAVGKDASSGGSSAVSSGTSKDVSSEVHKGQLSADMSHLSVSAVTDVSADADKDTSSSPNSKDASFDVPRSASDASDDRHRPVIQRNHNDEGVDVKMGGEDDEEGVGDDVKVTFLPTLEAVFADKKDLLKILPSTDDDLPPAVGTFTPLITMISTLNHLVPLPLPLQLQETTPITIA